MRFESKCKNGVTLEYVDFTMKEEEEFARVTFQMMRKQRWLMSKHFDFLDSKCWFGRAGHATAMQVSDFEHWMDALEYYNESARSLGKNDKQIFLDALSAGADREAKGHPTFMLGDLITVKKTIRRIWKSAWEESGIGMAHERYKEWPYPSLEEMLSGQARRLKFAERQERNFWTAYLNDPAEFTSDDDRYDYIRESYKLAPEILEEIDREEWETLKEKIARDLDIPVVLIHDVSPIEKREDADEDEERRPAGWIDPENDPDAYAVHLAEKKYGTRACWY